MRSLSVLICVAVLFGGVSAFRCYLCNSEMQPDCMENFDKFLKGCPVKSFGGLKNQKAIGCRKTEQTIGEEFVIIRECAYSGEDLVNKMNKGSTGIKRYVNQCSDKHGCNGATSSSFIGLSFALALCALFR